MDKNNFILFPAILMALNVCLVLSSSSNSWSAYSDTSSFRDVLNGRSYEETFGGSGDPYENLFSSSFSGGYGGGGGGGSDSQVSAYQPQEKTTVRVVQQRSEPDYSSAASGGQRYTSPAVTVRSGGQRTSSFGSSYRGTKGYSQPTKTRVATKTYQKPAYNPPPPTKTQQRVDTDYDSGAGAPEPSPRIPETNFQCYNRAYGYYADVEAGCQIFHVCQPDGRKWSFFCPNQTLYHQKVQTCDWWYNVDCPSSPDFYFLNERIGVLPAQDATLHRF